MRTHLIAAAALVLSLPALSAWAQSGCAPGQTLCQYENGSRNCVDTRSHDRHCGRCGNSCHKQERCRGGRCVRDDDNRCERGQTMCQQDNGTRRCTDTRSDERHCGRCGNVCRRQERCRDGACHWDCPGGQMFCPQRRDGSQGCTDTRTDRYNCGGCGQACPTVRPNCRDGRCTGGNEGAGDRCEAGQTMCPQQDGTRRCTNTRSDERHCGRCGNVCRTQERCRDGACHWDCPGGQTFCPQRRDGSMGCTDTRTDPYNCGGCGQACPSVSPRCREGRCG